jgi:hypothetical protein
MPGGNVKTALPWLGDDGGYGLYFWLMRAHAGRSIGMIGEHAFQVLNRDPTMALPK